MRLAKIGLVLFCGIVTRGDACSEEEKTKSKECYITIVNAGVDKLDRPTGAPIMLDATVDDCEGGFSIQWEFISVPVDSAIAVGSASFPDATSEYTGASDGLDVPVSFVCDVAGEYVLKMNVIGHDRVDDQVLVSCIDEITSLATCGTDLSVVLGDDAVLDGSASVVLAGQDIEYEWTLLSIPGDSAISSDLESVAAPTFTPDVIGDYEAQLRVRGDGGPYSLPCTTLVEVSLEPPTAIIATSDASVSICTAGTSFDLNATSSISPGGATLSYAWTLLETPLASVANINSFGDSTAEITTFTPDVFGDYKVGLQVTSFNGTSLVGERILSALEGGTAPMVFAGQNVTADIDVSCTISKLGTLICDPCVGPFDLSAAITSDDNDVISVSWMGIDAALNSTFNPPNSAQTAATILPRYPDANGNTAQYTLPFVVQVSDCSGTVVEDTINVTLNCTGVVGGGMD